MMLTSGSYIAFLDDDDYFLPTKIEKQINSMKNTNCSISCTDAYGGNGQYDLNSQYNVYLYKGIHWDSLINIYRDRIQLFESMYKNDINIWGGEELHIHNCCVCSSIVIKKDLINQAGYFPIKSYGEDWEYWKELIKYSKCVFLREPLTYLDQNHGDGQCY